MNHLAVIAQIEAANAVNEARQTELALEQATIESIQAPKVVFQRGWKFPALPISHKRKDFLMNTIFPPSVTYFSTNIEHSILFDRPDGEQVNLCVQHFGSCQEVNLVILGGTFEEPVKREEVNLTFQEARLLRDLLLRPEVQAYLDKE